MQPYLFLTSITFIITIISLFIEIDYPFVKDILEVNIVGIFILRYLHLLVAVYLITFLCFFNPNSFSGKIYLILAIVVEFLRHFLGCCILSYYELLMYGTGLHYPKNYHPSAIVFFREYDHIALSMMGLIIFITFHYILFKNEMFFIYKLCIGLTFGYIFVSHIIEIKNT
jgi:hypothetical protein